MSVTRVPAIKVNKGNMIRYGGTENIVLAATTEFVDGKPTNRLLLLRAPGCATATLEVPVTTLLTVTE